MLPELAMKKVGLEFKEREASEKRATLTEALKHLTELKEMAEVSKAIQALAQAEMQQQQQQTAANPFSALKELGLDVKSILELTNKQAETAQEKADKMMLLFLQMMMALMESKSNAKGSDLETMLALTKALVEMQNSSSDRVVKAIEKLLEEREGGGKKEDPIQNAMTTIFVNLMQRFVTERMSPPQPQDPVSQLKDALGLLQAVSSLVPQNSGMSEIEKLRIDLEREKLQHEIEMDRLRWKEEQEFRRQTEEKRLQLWEKLSEQVGAALPVLLQNIGAKPGIGFSAPMSKPVTDPPVVPTGDVQVICDACGADFLVPASSQYATCPKCGLSLILESEAPGPEVQARASENGVTKSAYNEPQLGGLSAEGIEL